MIPTLTTMLLGSLPALAEGRSDGLDEQVLDATTVIRVDILAVGEAITYEGVGTLTLEDPSGNPVATLSDGEQHLAQATGAFTARVSESTDDWEIVVAGTAPGFGRVWSTEWSFDAGSFETTYDGSFFARVDGGSPTDDAVIEFAARGWAGFQWKLSANAFGVTGANGRSVPSDSATFQPEFPIYLRPPEAASYSLASPAVEMPRFEADTGTCNIVAPPDRPGAFRFVSGTSGTAHVLCDLDGDGSFDITADEDLQFIAPVQAGEIVVEWDGTDASGEPVDPVERWFSVAMGAVLLSP
ncbi:MAG: hypothetical protein AAF211_13580, partial [Myxococcota bacterium]